MKLKAELTLEKWNYILEVINQHNSVEIKKLAISMLSESLKEHNEELQINQQ